MHQSDKPKEYYEERVKIAQTPFYKAFSAVARSEGMSSHDNIMAAFTDHGGDKADPDRLRSFVKELKTKTPELFDIDGNLSQRMNKQIRQRAGLEKPPSAQADAGRSAERPAQGGAGAGAGKPAERPDLKSRMNSLIRRKAYED